MRLCGDQHGWKTCLQVYQRAGFLKNNLWVTRYKRDEIFSTGIAVNQSAPGVGLPLYAADNESVKNADLVAWPTIGFHHVPMAEDWPVMPVERTGFHLKPTGFFRRSPAMDVAPSQAVDSACDC